MIEHIKFLIFCIFLFLGCFEILFSIIGLIHFKNPYFKIHVNSKIPTSGLLFIFISLLLYSKFCLFHLFFIFIILFFSSSLSSHVLSRINFKK